MASMHIRIWRRVVRSSLAALTTLVASLPVSAQTLAEMRDAMEIMVNTATICSDYLQRPEVMEEWQGTAMRKLTELGMASAEAEAFIAKTIADARAETPNETQKQVACEMVNIPALK